MVFISKQSLQNDHCYLGWSPTVNVADDNMGSSIRLVGMACCRLGGVTRIPPWSPGAGCCCGLPDTLHLISSRAIGRLLPVGGGRAMGSPTNISRDASLAHVLVLPVSTPTGVGILGSTDDSVSPMVAGTVSWIVASKAFSGSGAGISTASPGCSKPRAEDGLHTRRNNESCYLQWWTYNIQVEVLEYLQSRFFH
jgi:hypothetical protein